MKAEVISSMGKSSSGSNPIALNKQPFAAAKVIHEIVNVLYNKLRTNVPVWKSLLSTYIGNKDTENVLYSPIRVNFVIQRRIFFRQFQEFLFSEKRRNDLYQVQKTASK